MTMNENDKQAAQGKDILPPPHPRYFGIPAEHWEAAKNYAEYLAQNKQAEPVAWVDPVALGSVNKDYDRGFSDAVAECKRLNHPAQPVQPAVAQVPQSLFAGWQRRYKYPSTPGQVCAWEQCSTKEATDPFEKKPAYEYRKIYTAPPAVAVNEQMLEALENLTLACGRNSGWEDYPQEMKAANAAIRAAEAAKKGGV